MIIILGVMAVILLVGALLAFKTKSGQRTAQQSAGQASGSAMGRASGNDDD